MIQPSPEKDLIERHRDDDVKGDCPSKGPTQPQQPQPQPQHQTSNVEKSKVPSPVVEATGK